MYIFLYILHNNFVIFKIDVKNIDEQMEISVLPSYQESKLGKILMCFSIYTNTKIIFNTKLEGDSIPIIHGIRFITMVWIVMGHSVLYSSDYFGK